MTEQTTCPACGAPLEYRGTQDVVTCGFCNTEIQVVREGDQPRFQVLAQPEPQKEVLSQPVEPASKENLFGQAVPDDTPGEPVFSPFEASSSNQEPLAPPPVSPPPWTGDGAQVYTPAGAETAPRGGLPRWAIIVIAVVVGLCLLCACAAGAIAIVSGGIVSSSGGF